MATDSNTPSNALDRDSSTHNESIFAADEQDSVFDAVQLAQAEGAAPAVQAAAPTGVPGAPQQVAIPAGTDVVRIAVQPGEVLELGAPFTGGAELIGRIGDGNLAIKVGEVTVILQGYVDANQQAPVTIETADGQPIDVATMLASTDPAIDIQTAAGPGDAAGAQGADNNGALFSQFGPGGGLGGFTGVGAQDQTELSYGLIDASIRNDFADPLLGTGATFGIAVGPLSGGHSERFLRDPAQTTPLGSFADFMTEYQDAVENHENPMFPGWADFQGTGATSGDFEEYLQQTRRTVDVDATFTGATGSLVLNDIVAGITSNGSTLTAYSADQGQTLFVRRDSDNALVAVIHVEPTDTGFTIDTYMINRIDHPGAGTGDAGRDEMVIGIEFTVYDGPSPYQQEGEGTTQSPSIDSKAEFKFADDVPLFDNVTYHNLDGAPGDDGINDSTSKGLIDEDWLQTGANDKGADGTSNAGANDDTHGSFYVNGQINITFGADGPAQTDNPKDEAADKHAFALDTGGYTQGEVFHYGDGTLSSGGETLYVLAVSDSQLIVGIPAPEDEGPVDSVAIDAVLGTPIFSLTLNQATGAFTFTLFGPLDHTSELFFGEPEDIIPLAFNVTATDDDGDTVPATIHIDVNDDIPVARDDSDNLPAGTYGPEGGNVMTGFGTEFPITGTDSQGADSAIVTKLVGFDGSVDSDSSNGLSVVGQYGTLTMSETGEYSYARDPKTPGGVSDVFTYTLTDKDGDTSTATLTVKIGNADVTVDTPSGRDGTIVFEHGLPERNGSEPAGSGENGTNNDDPSEAAAGVITITAKDGVATVQVGANTALTLTQLNDLTANPVTYSDATGALKLTGFDEGTGKLSYTYTLLDNTTDDPDSVSFDIKVIDIDGSDATGTLKITIVDDEPTANDDTDSLDNVSKTASGNVVTGTDTTSSGADIQGADAAKVTGASSTTGGDQSADINGDTTVAGKYGLLSIAADGTYTYTRTDSTPLTDTDTFTYTLEDADGDKSTATLTINITDKGVTITDLTPDTGGGDVIVDEDDLADGSDATKESTTGTGTFKIDAPDGVDEVSIAGTKVIDNGALTATLTITTPLGNTLTVTGYDSGTGVISYSYTLNDNTTTHASSGEDSVFENLAVTLTDIDGDTANGTLSAKIVDDVPTAKNDTDSVGNVATTGGNVITGANTSSGAAGADVPGADGATVTKLQGSTSSDSTNSDGLTAVGTYGTLTMSANGEYTYTRSGNTPLNDTDTFTYTLEDADGDKSTATLIVSINDQDVTISNLTPSANGGDVSVDEDDLSDGSDTTKESTTATGTFTISAPDGVDEVTIAGIKVIDNGALTANLVVTTPLGNTLTVTDYTAGVITYTFTLNDNTTTHSSATGEDSVYENLAVTLTDVDGDTANGTLSAGIVDDVPTAKNDTDSLDNVTNTASGNVISAVGTTSSGADVPGADGATVTKLVGSATSDSDNSNDLVAVGTYGTLSMSANGQYTYTRSGTAPLTDTDTFTYTLEDADGDKSTATLTISITDKGVQILDLTPSAGGGDVSVDEDDLSDGSDSSKESTTGTGTFTVSASDGVDEVSIAGTKVIDNGALTANLTITTPLGNTLTVTGYDSGTGVISYSYTLNDNTTTHSSATGEDSVYENLAVTLTDVDGDTANGTLSAGIVDDVPTANNDTDSLDNVTNSATGNVITGANTTSSGADVPGADGASITKLEGSKSSDSDSSGGFTAAGTFGTLQMSANGEYTYTRSGNGPLTNTDTFTYTLQDADGDKSTATLIVSINDQDVTISNLTPSGSGGDVTVDEDDLSAARGIGESAGSDSTPESTIGSGDFKISAPDGVDEVSIAGTKVIDNGALTANLTVNTPLGNTLTVTGYDSGTGVVSYTYTLKDNTTTHSAATGEDGVFENLAVTLTDVDGDQATGTLSAKIVDDVPTANADATSVSAGGLVSDNVESNDIFGADGKDAGGGVVGVVKGTSTSLPVSGGTGVAIAGDYGTLTLNANGTYDYQAKANVDLPAGASVDHFVYTIKDADGDLSTTKLDITVNNVVLKTETQTVTVYEAALDKTQDPGDLLAGTVIGSDPTSTKETVTGTLTFDPGITTVTKDYTGLYGKLHVDGTTGAFTYTLSTNIIGSPAANDGANTYLAAESFSIQIKDGGGNTGTDTIKINVVDDTPTAFDPADQTLLNSGLGGVITGALNAAGHGGADGISSVVFSGGTDGSKATLADGTTAMLYQTHNILLTGFGTTQLTGTADINNNGKIDAGETQIFTVKLDVPNDRYEFDLLKPIDNGAKIDFTSLANAHAGADNWIGVGADFDGTTSRDLLYTASDYGTTNKDALNASSNDIGTNNQWIDPGESVRMDFVNGLVTDGKGFNFTSHYQVQDMQFTIKDVQGNANSITSVKLSAFDVKTNANSSSTTDASFLLQDPVALTAGELVVFRNGSNITGTLSITTSGDSAIINGLKAGDVIQIDEASGFDRLLVEPASQQSNAFAITGTQVLNTSIGFDLDAKFETTLTDGDGDTSKGQYIGVHLETDDGQAHTLTGGTGNDTIHGGTGNDTLSGAGGNDFIFGDAGNDTMLYDSADKYDGGAGFDRVQVATAGTALTYDSAKFIGVEMIDLGDGSDRNGAGQNTLSLSATDVIAANGGVTAGAIPGHNINLFVMGDTAGTGTAEHDNVIMTGFGSKLATGVAFVDPSTGVSHNYDVYATVAQPLVKVAIETNLDVS